MDKVTLIDPTANAAATPKEQAPNDLWADIADGVEDGIGWAERLMGITNPQPAAPMQFQGTEMPSNKQWGWGEVAALGGALGGVGLIIWMLIPKRSRSKRRRK